MPKTDCTDNLKALADRSRMRIVKALLAEARGVNELAEASATTTARSIPR